MTLWRKTRVLIVVIHNAYVMFNVTIRKWRWVFASDTGWRCSRSGATEWQITLHLRTRRTMDSCESEFCSNWGRKEPNAAIFVMTTFPKWHLDKRKVRLYSYFRSSTKLSRKLKYRLLKCIKHLTETSRLNMCNDWNAVISQANSHVSDNKY